MLDDASMSTALFLKPSQNTPENNTPVELLKRRQKAKALKFLKIFLISVATLFSINMITTFQATQSVPVAVRNIQKGSVIKQSDFHYVNVPKSSVFNNVLSYTSVNNSAKNAIIATCNIKYGMPIFTNQVAKQIKIPPGFTTISVKLASNSTSLTPADVISIAFSKVPNGESNANDIVLENKNISLVHGVIVVNVNSSTQSALLAMPAENALQIINTQAIIPNLAVIAVQN